MSDMPPEPADLPANEGLAPTDFPPEADFERLDVQPQFDGAEVVENQEVSEIGNPEELAVFWRFQGNNNDCGLYSQGGIIEANGQEFDIEKFRQQGTEEGWYSPEEGTDLGNFGALLQDNNVPVDRYEYSSFQDMADALSEGKGIAVAVDCEPIWGQPGGHALWVTGMQIDSEGTPISIICNDSGREDGCAIAYPFEAFSDAWAASGNMMVVTKEPLAALS